MRGGVRRGEEDDFLVLLDGSKFTKDDWFQGIVGISSDPYQTFDHGDDDDHHETLKDVRKYGWSCDVRAEAFGQNDSQGASATRCRRMGA